jgi:hypothetical protein
MATTTTIDSTYAGEAAAGFLAEALLKGSTIKNGGIEVKQNIKYKEVMQKLATDANVIKNGTCDFTPTGTVAITERILQPEEFQVNLEFCTQKWLDSWEAISMGYSAYNTPPKNFTNYIMGHVAKMVAASTETNIWEGVNGTEGQFDGFVPLALADATVLDVPNHAVVNAANVVEKLGSIVDLIPSALYGVEDLHIYISQNIARAYVRALGGFAATNSGVNAQSHMWYGDGALTFDGVKLFVANGLADDTAMATQKSNLFFGTGLLSDQNQAKILDMSNLDGSQNFRVIMRYTAGIQYAIGSEIVLYHA